MSATVTIQEIEIFKKHGGNVLTLFERFHKHQLPVPIIYKLNKICMYFYLLRKVGQYIKMKKPLFIFAPTINECEKIFKFLHIFFKDGSYVHSKKDNTKIISYFKNHKLDYLVTTAVLERGVTVSNLQVIVFNAHNDIYTSQALIQIAGRVGRKKDAPEGEVIFLANTITKAMEDAVDSIKEANKNLQNLFQQNQYKKCVLHYSSKHLSV